MNEQTMIGMFLPEGVLDYFEVKSVNKNGDSYTIKLEEYNKFPEQFKGEKLVSKGFHPEVTIQDFPQRGKPCYLKVKRRRWLNEDTNQWVSRNWDLVAKGTRMTEEFATFLKGIVR